MPDDNRTTTVQLGCGTLILIALIVLFFSGGGSKRNEEELRRIESEISGLRTDVRNLTDEVSRLNRRLPAKGD